MLTSQAIKDQEFQVKFRGYDTIEVKAYLELLAEDFFQLTEQSQVQAEEIESLLAVQEALQMEKEAVAEEAKANQENSDSIQANIDEGYQSRDQEIEQLKAQVTELEEANASLKEEKEVLSLTVEELEEKLTGDKAGATESQTELEKLRGRLALLEEQNEQLKQEGLDFKTTILAAQKFADNLRKTSEDDAKRMLDEAHAEVEKFRSEAEAELTRLPKEIEALKKKKERVRDEVRAQLLNCLDTLDEVLEGAVAEQDDELSNLFESIQIPDDENLDGTDDIDSINVELK